MAFENVFSGVDWQAQERNQAREQNQFMQALGMSMAAAEREEDRDLKRRQLEQKASTNYKQIAMDELNRVNMGGQPTPQGQAALKVMEQTSAPKVYFDPVSGQQVMQPSPWQSMGGAQGINPRAGMGGLPMDAQIDAMTLPQAQTPVGPVIRPDMNTAQMNIDALSQPAMEMPAMDGAPSIQAPMGSSPKTQQLAQEENVKLQAEYAKLKGASKQKFLAEKLDKQLSDESMLPIINEMIKTNRGTLDMPFAEFVNAPARILRSDQADAMDSLKQDQLSLAAPLAKMLGTNPTDKDFQASLDQIINLNSTKEGREQQLIKRRDRILKKIGKSKPAQDKTGAVNYMEYFK